MYGSVYFGATDARPINDNLNPSLLSVIQVCAGCLSASIYSGARGGIATLTIVRDAFYPEKYYAAVHFDSQRENVFRTSGSIENVIRQSWGYLLH